jgi:hypothetical protein
VSRLAVTVIVTDVLYYSPAVLLRYHAMFICSDVTLEQLHTVHCTALHYHTLHWSPRSLYCTTQHKCLAVQLSDSAISGFCLTPFLPHSLLSFSPYPSSVLFIPLSLSHSLSVSLSPSLSLSLFLSLSLSLSLHLSLVFVVQKKEVKERVLYDILGVEPEATQGIAHTTHTLLLMYCTHHRHLIAHVLHTPQTPYCSCIAHTTHTLLLMYCTHHTHLIAHVLHTPHTSYCSCIAHTTHTLLLMYCTHHTHLIAHVLHTPHTPYCSCIAHENLLSCKVHHATHLFIICCTAASTL